jgi:polyhydroxyalkanoate synthesis regulator phasin
MKNKEMVVIPQYLFDELIEYFDNKSDADNSTPNKEMKILSQLQEEHSNSTDELRKEVEFLKSHIKDLEKMLREAYKSNSSPF